MKKLCLALAFATIFCAPLAAQENVATPEQKSTKDQTSQGADSLARPPGSFKLGVTQTGSLGAPDQTRIDRAKLDSNEAIQNEAEEALESRNFDVADKLYAILCQRDPKNPNYFYAAGNSYYSQGNYPSAFANIVTAWHLADNSATSAYVQAANSTVEKLRILVEKNFRLTFGYDSREPETIVNAATRLWKSGFTQQSVQLNEYALKNEPLCAQIAAYNLGAIAEHNRDYWQALAYYQSALQRSRQLEANHDPKISAQISKSLAQLPTSYIEQAITETQQALRGYPTIWRGWVQTTSYPKHWGSEVCPLCAISRTDPEYKSGQMTLVP
jgi:tetratricopeptide (TPR) repeat protein